MVENKENPASDSKELPDSPEPKRFQRINPFDTSSWMSGSKRATLVRELIAIALLVAVLVWVCVQNPILATGAAILGLAAAGNAYRFIPRRVKLRIGVLIVVYAVPLLFLVASAHDTFEETALAWVLGVTLGIFLGSKLILHWDPEAKKLQFPQK